MPSNCEVLSILGVVQLLIVGAYLVALIVPGEHPDKEIRWLLEITQRISKK
jgi:hypothetical protein